MKQSDSTKQTVLGLLGFAFVVLGSYNSVVINSDEFMGQQEVRFVKRLDEMNGVVKAGRLMANHGQWTKLSPGKVLTPPKAFISAVKAPLPQVIEPSAPAAPVDTGSTAAIQEELDLSLAEVFNAKKFPQAPKPGSFSGSLTASDGTISSISVTLPNGETFSVSSADMVGNVFQYPDESAGTEDGMASGMIYPMDKQSYMVTLTNGSLEGTRLKFNVQKEEEYGNNASAVAENTTTDSVGDQPAQAEESGFAPVVSDNGATTPVDQFGTQPSPEQQPEAVANTEATPAEAPAFFDENAQQNASTEQVAAGGADGAYGFNFNDAPASL